MKILALFSLFVLCTADSAEGPSPVSNQTTSPSDTTSTVVSSTHSDISSTTLLPTTTSDVSTSVVPESTTVSSSTSSSSTSPSTSVSPVTPTKTPEPAKCSFNVTKNGVTCIRADLKAKFLVDIEGNTYPIILDCNRTLTDGDCSLNETQTLILYEPSYYNLTMVFEKDAKNVFIRNVTFTYDLPQGHGDVSNSSEKLFEVKPGNSYLCKTELDIHMENVTMEISEIQIQGFGESNKDFGKTEECEADDKVSDIIPIAVGIALGSLIIVVLIAYLVGRRRSRQKGYQSV